MDILHHLVRVPGLQALWTRFPVGSLATRMRFDIAERPAYAYGVYSAAMMAKRLGLGAISVMEFGVAGGRGLLALQRLAAEVERALSVRIAVYGFDSGSGMPPPVDYRDLPHVWGEGFYKMDVDALRTQLGRAHLLLGDLRETVPRVMTAPETPPLGFAAFDLDYYSSTTAAFSIFDAPESTHLPRVHSYFDDLGSTDLGCMNTYVGEHLAIKEFNERNPERKICRIEQLRLNRTRWEDWQDRMYAFHNFAHSAYTRHVLPSGAKHQQLPL